MLMVAVNSFRLVFGQQDLPFTDKVRFLIHDSILQSILCLLIFFGHFFFLLRIFCEIKKYLCERFFNLFFFQYFFFRVLVMIFFFICRIYLLQVFFKLFFISFLVSFTGENVDFKIGMVWHSLTNIPYLVSFHFKKKKVFVF